MYNVQDSISIRSHFEKNTCFRDSDLCPLRYILHKVCVVCVSTVLSNHFFFCNYLSKLSNGISNYLAIKGKLKEK